MESGRPIMIVEDDPDDLFLIQRALEKADCHVPVVFFDNGEDAIAYLRNEPGHGGSLPLFLLTDIKVPRCNGFELVRWVRQQKFLQSLPVIFWSSSDSPEHVRRAYALGASSYFIKPVDFAEICRVVKLLVEYWARSESLEPVSLNLLAR